MVLYTMKIGQDFWSYSRLEDLMLIWRSFDGIDEVGFIGRSDVLAVRVVGAFVLAGSVGREVVVLEGLVGWLVVEPRLVGRKLVTLMVGRTVVGTE